MGNCGSRDDYLAEAQRGTAALKANDPERAIRHFCRSLELQPGNHLAFFGRAQALVRQARFEEARHDCDRCLGIAPDFYPARFVKSRCLEGMDEFDLAAMERARIPRALLLAEERAQAEVKRCDRSYTSLERTYADETARNANRHNFLRGLRGQYVQSAAARYEARMRNDRKWRQVAANLVA